MPLRLLIFCALSLHVEAANYYCATNGSSSNPGSIDLPWDLATGLNALTNNNTIVLLAGNFWTGPYTAPGGQGPATLQAQSKWSAGIVNGTTYNLAFQNIPGASTSITVDGLVISNSFGDDGISCSGLHDSTIQNCWIINNNQQGVNMTSAYCSNNTVQYCLVEGNGWINSSHYHGMYITGPNNVIRGNVCRYNCLGYGIVYYAENYPIWQNNTKIYNNLVYAQTNTYGISVSGDNNSGGSLPGTNYVYNNISLNGIYFFGGTAMVTNNIVAPQASHLTAFILGDRTPTIYADYNMGTSDFGYGSHNVVTDNLTFVNAGSGLYWTTPLSAARNAALSTACGPVDFFGNVQASVRDIGAFQYSAGYAADTRTLDPSPPGGADYWASLLPNGMVIVPPSVTANPQSQSAITGDNVTFTVDAAGTAPLEYRWWWTTDTGVTNTNPAWTNSALTLEAVQATNAGNFYAVVSGVGGAISSAIATLTVSSPPVLKTQPSDDFRTNGLVAFYPFNGNLRDQSGNGNDGTVVGPDWAYSADRFGQQNSLYLNLTSSPAWDSDGAYVEIPRSASFDFNNDFTLSLWVNILGGTPPSYVHSLISNGPDSSSANLRMISDVAGQGGYDLLEFVYILASGTSGGATYFLPSETQTWRQIIAVRSGANLSLYENGSFLSSVGMTTVSNSPTIWLGRQICLGYPTNCSDSYPLVGAIDDVRLYNRALSAQEISRLYTYETMPPGTTVGPIRLSLPVAPGITYQLESSTDLKTWTAYGPSFVGTTNSIAFQEVDTFGTQQFFRVSVVQPTSLSSGD